MTRITLDDVVEKIECPYLIVHGSGDRQIPADHAQRTYDAAVNARTRKLVLLTEEDGGVEHCSIDNPRYASELMSDWVADVLA